MGFMQMFQMFQEIIRQRDFDRLDNFEDKVAGMLLPDNDIRILQKLCQEIRSVMEAAEEES